MTNRWIIHYDIINGIIELLKPEKQNSDYSQYIFLLFLLFSILRTKYLNITKKYINMSYMYVI